MVWRSKTGETDTNCISFACASSALIIDPSSRLEDSLDRLGGTFREEGLSVGFSALRIQGESIEMTIDPV